MSRKYRWAKAWATFLSALVFGSTFVVMMESLPRCHEDGTNGVCKHLPTINNILTDTFLLELTVRIACFPRVRDCMLDGYTWVDVIALLPDMLELVWSTILCSLASNTQFVQECSIGQAYVAVQAAFRLSWMVE